MSHRRPAGRTVTAVPRPDPPVTPSWKRSQRTPRPPRILFWTYDARSPSFRHRHRPLLALLADQGWRCRVEEIAKGRYFRRILRRRRELAQTDVLVLAKIKLGLGEPLLLTTLPTRIVFDFDDAIYVRQAARLESEPDRSSLRRIKFRHTCRLAHLVLAGNEQLASASREHSNWVETIPTSIDLLPVGEKKGTGRTLVWIGMPENLKYLELIRRPLTELQQLYPDLKLRVICSQPPPWPEANIEWIPWSEQVETPALASADIGLMPLTDDTWSRGKCGFKLLQYMSHALPCVASPVGVNRDIVRGGNTGFLARSELEWFSAIRKLLDDLHLRQGIGMRGWDHVRRHYNRDEIVPRTAALLSRLLQEDRPKAQGSSRWRTSSTTRPMLSPEKPLPWR
ncbi:MAG: glycosyltransferase family 4 protein [Thermoanaerobaculia bacterium]|nr:glycosyltransferase family 4 protein [Thermoanaerobaculia bacterium]